jgi:hypothetical protein
MSKLKQIKIPVELHTVENKWRLVRTRDDLTKESEEIGFIEWNENGKVKDLHKGIEGLEIDRSLLMSPFNNSFTWQTTEIVDFHVREEGGWKFNTNNSEYELQKL